MVLSRKIAKAGVMSELSHLDEQGRARMVDVSGKEITSRIAIARGTIHMRAETLALILEDPARVDIEATVRVTGKTGVEMEAMTAVSVAGLTIYDMCKAVDREMTIGDIRLAKKSGGKSGTFIRKE
jgi:cyclic pyranopterin phosphate synthase